MGANRRNIFTGSGKAALLGSELGKGGEGSVYELPDVPDFVAKLYHKPVEVNQADKIAAMVASRSDRLLKLAAWPVETVHETATGPMIGLIMPKVAGYHEIHTLYGPKSRLTHFPQANWPFLIHTAVNVARAFNVIHQSGHVIGDVNQGNILVSNQGTVKIIDCDSFQISTHGRTFLCEVGVPTYTSPELQEKPFKHVTRTPNHDNFGLAVVIFHLLFMGRHPFSGRYFGPGESSAIEKSISAFRFAYGHNASQRQMRPPPATLALEAVSAPVAFLFERAFTPEGVNAGRPSAQTWIAELTALQSGLKTCSVNNGHSFLAALPDCPWCEIEAMSGRVCFNIAVTVASHLGTQTTPPLDVNVIWAQIVAVPAPGPLPNLVWPDTIQLSTQVVEAKQQRLTRRWLAVASAAVIAAVSFPLAGYFSLIFCIVVLTVSLGIANKPFLGLRREMQRQLAASEAHCNAAQKRWADGGSDTEFESKLQQLNEVKRQLQELPAQKQFRLHQLEQARYQSQLDKHLDKYKLWAAGLDGIGQGRKTILHSYGVETARDVIENNILAIPGFGPSLTSVLLDWRYICEKKFVFNPQHGVDPAEVAKVEREFTTKRLTLEQQLRQGPSALNQISQQLQYRRTTLKDGMEKALLAAAFAKANWEAVK